MADLMLRLARLLVARHEAETGQGVPESGEITKSLNDTCSADEPEVTLTQACRTLRVMQDLGLVELAEGFGPVVREDLGVLVKDRIYTYLEASESDVE